MSDVLWTGGRKGITELCEPAFWRPGYAACIALGDEDDSLTPDECDALAAALVQAAAKKRSEDRVRQLEQEGKVQP